MAQNPLILALETSSRIGSVALAQGPNLLAYKPFSGPMMHSAEIFPTINQLLSQFARRPKDIAHIYISIGPGSFTGLRIATAIAKSLNLANSARIIAVDSLDVIAANITNRAPNNSVRSSNKELLTPLPEKIAPILDAKRGQFYIAIYQLKTTKNALGVVKSEIPKTGYERVQTVPIMTTAQILEMFKDSKNPVHLLGDGLLYHREKFESKGARILDQSLWSPTAANVYHLGWQLAETNQFADPLALTPLYIRRPEAEEKWEKRNALP